MEKIKWGIVGPGIIAHEFAHDFQFASHAELVAVASRSVERGADFAKKYGIKKVFSSYNDLYNDPDVDAIYVATPHTFHFENSRDAIDSGKAVLCEKPLTHNLQDTVALLDHAQKKGIYLMEGMWTYFLPVIRKAVEWVDAGRIGEVKHVKANFGYPSEFDPSRRYYDPELAGGCLLDMGCYTIAMAWLFLKAGSGTNECHQPKGT